MHYRELQKKTKKAVFVLTITVKHVYTYNTAILFWGIYILDEGCLINLALLTIIFGGNVYLHNYRNSFHVPNRQLLKHSNWTEQM